MNIEIESSSEIRADSPLQWKSSTSKTQLWYKWLKHRIRKCLILELIFLIILILLLNNSYRTTSQNEHIFEMISHLQTRIDEVEARSCSNLPSSTNNKGIVEQETNLSEKSINQNIEGVKTPTEPTFTEPPIKVNQNTIRLNKPEPFNVSFPQFNAASYLSGAFAFPSQSSRQANYSYLDQSEYVILEREPIQNKSWCTQSINPILTIVLSQKIQPVAVSYQHLKWNGTVPNGAPELYDVKTCLDQNCSIVIPLAFNCEYKSSGGQEQSCSIEYNQNIMPLIDRIQFHFHKNHGNVNLTCAYLVRVFGEGKPSGEVEQLPESHKETCSSLIWHRENYPYLYNNILIKDCKTLYNNDCCVEC